MLVAPVSFILLSPLLTYLQTNSIMGWQLKDRNWEAISFPRSPSTFKPKPSNSKIDWG